MGYNLKNKKMEIAEKILKSIVDNKDLVKYHNGWGYYIKTPFEEIHMIGLIKVDNSYTLALYFGDTQSQSRAFYAIDPKIELLKNSDWHLRPNFHFQNSFGKNLIWFDSKVNNSEYISFWQSNKKLLYKHPIDKITELVELLSNKGIITIEGQKKLHLQNIIYNSDYSSLNICAGFGLEFTISDNTLKSLDDEDKLISLLITKINEGLSIIGKNGNSFLKNIIPNNNFENFPDKEYPAEECGDPDGL